MNKIAYYTGYMDKASALDPKLFKGFGPRAMRYMNRIDKAQAGVGPVEAIASKAWGAAGKEGTHSTQQLANFINSVFNKSSKNPEQISKARAYLAKLLWEAHL